MVSLTPHMHLRGKSFRIDLIDPAGTRQLLLDVPRYDFNWQNSYVFEKPLKLAAGSRLECNAAFDNSAGNPANPDPSKTVYWGDQSWEEMLIGSYELVVPAPQRKSNSAESLEKSPRQPVRKGAGSAGKAPTLKTQYGELQIFPVDNPWNQDVSRLPVHPKSHQYLKSIGLDRPLHPDFGTVWNGAPMGIPYVVVSKDQKKVPVEFEYKDESDMGPYPIPADAPIEGGIKSDGDRHILVIDFDNQRLYETFSSYPQRAGWKAGSGAIFDLTSNKLRPAGWTSADAAGLPIFPGLVRYDEAVEQGEIRHALRFTCRKTQRGYISPATHWASKSKDRNLPPMGLRVRLRADFDVSGYPKSAQTVLIALKKYGMFLADNGGDWFVSGAPDPKWNDEQINTLKKVRGRDFEALQTGELVTD
ncbi:MAG: hypothetical protein K8R88_14310, partial [Armatimonadetes bacterium]|nr:hypothetical protein [Armatimonadota bacterium]